MNSNLNYGLEKNLSHIKGLKNFSQVCQCWVTFLLQFTNYPNRTEIKFCVIHLMFYSESTRKIGLEKIAVIKFYYFLKRFWISKSTSFLVLRICTCEVLQLLKYSNFCPTNFYNHQ